MRRWAKPSAYVQDINLHNTAKTVRVFVFLFLYVDNIYTMMMMMIVHWAISPSQTAGRIEKHSVR